MTVHVAKGILFDRSGKVLIYLRDDKPNIPYPNQWDLLGGGVEPDETPREALVREIQEEISVQLTSPHPTILATTSANAAKYSTSFGGRLTLCQRS